MISHYISHCVRALDSSGIIKSDQMAKILGVDPDKYQAIIRCNDGSQISIEQVDRFVEFFGIACLQSNFIRSIYGNEGSPYKTWDDLDKEQQKQVNLGSVYVASHRASINCLSYVKECEYFLDGCSNLVEVVKQAGDEESATEE